MEDYLRTTGCIEQKILFKKKSGDIYCIGSRESDKYLYASSEEARVIYFVLHEIEQGKSLRQIEELAFDQYRLPPETVKAIVKKGKESGLIEIPEKESIKKHIDEFELMMVNLKEFPLKRLYPLFIFFSNHMRSVVVIMIATIVVSAYMLFFNNKWKLFPWGQIFSDQRTLIYMWIIQFFSLVLHEFSHAAVGYKYGARPKSFSIAVFYYYMLIFYIKLPGIYFQKGKERIKIWSAGIIMNLFLASCFALLLLSGCNRLELFLMVGIVSNIMLAVNNLLPFFYSDGYYMLTTLLKAPNLRKKSFFQIKKLIKNGFSKDTMVYWVYLVITVTVTICIVGGQILIIAKSVYNSILFGSGFGEIIREYLNLFIIAGIGIIGKMITRIRKVYKKE